MNLTSPAADLDKPPGWGTSLVISLLVIDMVAHSLTAITPAHRWREALAIRQFPLALPTPAEVRELRRRAAPGAIARRCGASARSVAAYLMPWPDGETRRRMHGWGDAARFTVAWIDSRLTFLENVVGIKQGWKMFSPDVSRRSRVARVTLVFADGTTSSVRLLSDPDDPTRYAHWFQNRVLLHESELPDADEACLGYANFLSHRHPRNEVGAPLEWIRFHAAWYDMPNPRDPTIDPVAFMTAQRGPPPDQIEPVTFAYDVRRRAGHRLPASADVPAREGSPRDP